MNIKLQLLIPIFLQVQYKTPKKRIAKHTDTQTNIHNYLQTYKKEKILEVILKYHI